MRTYLRFVVALFIYSTCLHKAEGHQLQVGTNLAYKSIHNAISAAKTGDSVIVHAGVYHEKNIIINKSISVIGINYPILDGDYHSEIVSIKANHVLVRGFKIQHTGNGTLDDPAGIKIYDSKYVTISDNNLEDTFFGIYVQYGTSCIIKNNQLKSSGIEEQEIGNGIHCWKSDSIQIIGNSVSGHRDGIYFEFVTNSLIWLNVSKQNLRYGLHFMFSNNDSYIGNIFKNNGAGVAVMFTNHVKMFNNVFEENWGDAAYGLLLKEISDSYINGNTFSKNTVGILMEGTSRIEAQKNNFEHNGWAMKIQASCMDIAFTKNNFIANTFDVATNGSLVLNTFNGNYWDKYEGYDLNKDKVGDIPYRPISMFSMIIENNPPAMMLFRSIMVSILDKTEKILPSLTPENLKDNTPLMKALRL
ncbi:MAG: nitrous oxide reductase family maturation protein NosD [Bacteroidetes bacterium]|nr:nitrous oxide reductase family maturation protein NosD [Bacteroidota bacterium]